MNEEISQFTAIYFVAFAAISGMALFENIAVNIFNFTKFSWKKKYPGCELLRDPAPESLMRYQSLPSFSA